MDTERNLIEYLPPYLAQYGEISGALRAEEPEFNEMNAIIEDILGNEFIETADEYGISHFEKMLGILSYATDTLDDRRLRVLSKFNESAPFTMRSLDEMLRNICGENGYVLELIADEYLVRVRIALKVRKQAEIAAGLLERIIPCNMRYSAELLFNTWQLVRNFSWGAVKAHSWNGVKEEALS